MKDLREITTIMAFCFILLLPSCSKTVTPEYVEWANKVCDSNGGLKFLQVKHIAILELYPNAVCNNGAKFISIDKDYK